MCNSIPQKEERTMFGKLKAAAQEKLASNGAIDGFQKG